MSYPGRRAALPCSLFATRRTETIAPVACGDKQEMRLSAALGLLSMNHIGKLARPAF